MSLLARLLHKAARAVTWEQDRTAGLVALLSAAGVPVNEREALGLSALWCGLRVVSEAVGMMPLHLYKKWLGDGRVRAEAHPLYYLLRTSPNPEHTRPVFFETLQSHALLHGNAYAEVQRSQAGGPVARWPIHPTRVRPGRAATGAVVYQVAAGPGQPAVTLPAADVLHVPGLGPDGSAGWRLVELGRNSLGFAIAAQRHGAAQFRNGGRPGGVITMKGAADPEATENLRRSWQQMHAGADNAGKVPLLEEGMTFTPFVPTNEQSQYTELLAFFVYEVARLLNVPPSKLHDLAKASWRNLETFNQDFLTTTLQPRLGKWEAEISRKLLPNEQREYYAEFNPDVLVRVNY